MKTTTTTTNLFRANIAGSTVGMSLMPAAVPAAMSAMMVAVLACAAGSAQAQSVVGWGSNLQGQLNGTSSVGAVIEISSGIYHNVGARQDGTIVAWGSNNAGQLDVPTPALTDVTYVSAGDYHSIAARANGTAACWGDNFFGACDVPVGLINVIGVSAGEQFSGALLADGTVVVWGWDSLNRLGVPADLTRVIKLDLGADFGVALRSTGDVVAWGTGARAVPPLGLLAKDISAGVTHSIAIRLDGTLACWGTSNAYGECTPPAEAAGSVAIAAGSQFSLGLRSDGKVVCWGKNNRGQAPAAPGFAPVTNGVAIAAGFEHSIASQNPAGIQAPTATLVAATATSCGNINGAIDVTVTNAETSWWTGPNGFFSNSDDLSGLAADSYTLLVVGPGGSATLSVEVTAGADTIAPVIASYNASASDAAGANCTAIVPDFTASVVASDNCTASGALTITQSPAAGASVGLGANTVVITVKDSSLNQTTANVTFTVSGTAVTYYNDADTDGFGAINDGGTSACSPIVGKVVDHTDCNDMALTYGDGDSDGFGAGVAVACGVLTNNDCNDNSAAIYPGATEVCNHIDDNCVGGIDEGLIFNVYYRDADSDGYGDTTDTGVTDCVRLPGTTTNREDCNDSDGAIYPGAVENCANILVNNDCDGDISAAEAIDSVSYYADGDQDGFGFGAATKSCVPTGPTNNSDCDDTRLLYADNDGDTFGAGPAVACGVQLNTDCNDIPVTGVSIYPGAVENCANLGTDNDCDGVNDAAEAIDSVSYYVDGDQDGFGFGAATKSCSAIVGSVTNNSDCDDTKLLYADNDGDTFGAGPAVACGVVSNTDCNDIPVTGVSIYPGAVENCANDGIDNDCDGEANSDFEAIDATAYFPDLDGDTFGAGSSVQSCTALIGRVPNNTDCNDLVFAIQPGAPELCADSNVDNNCDGVSTSVDTNAADKVDFFRDQDFDTYSINVTAKFCTGTTNAGYVATLSSPIDCNDNNAAINPGATEICDVSNVDENCNGFADNDDSGAADAGKTNFYADIDNDTYTLATASRFCDIVAGYRVAVSASIDCNDNVAAINPGATEICDASNVDENCNGFADNDDSGAADAGKTNFYADIDNDTYTVAAATRFCDIVTGYRVAVSASIDCNDNNAAINPGATEICDASNVDENCNGFADNDDSGAADAGKTNFYADIDNDTYTVAAATRFCDIVTGYRVAVSASIDCNDNVAAINPGATEVCDATNTDENCNGLADNDDSGAADAGKTNFYADIDNDTYTLATADRFCDIVAGYRAFASALSDCNDAVAAINPGVTEICDAANVDENCNGFADNDDSGAADAGKTNFYADIDNDTYTLATASRFCDIVAGYRVAVSASIDCNDAVAAINPGATEICDASNVDENCNGFADNDDSGAADAGKTNFYADIDNDTYTLATADRFCDIVAGYRVAVSASIDCNDNNAAINPGATEICDALNVDENCNGFADNDDSGAADAGKTNFYADADNDTYTLAPATRFCDIVAGYRVAVSASIDCNDNVAAINPGATEICDASNVDENCNGFADNDDSGAADAGKTNFYADIDNDTYTLAAATRFCDIVAGYRVAVSALIDCNDAVAAINPGATEICDATNTDENCNNLADNDDSAAADAGKTNFYADADDDTYTVAAATRFCDIAAGYRVAVSASIDCNDAVAAINPGATEICDAANVDENCNGFADNDDSGAADASKTNFYADADNDTYTLAAATRFCDIVSGYLTAPSALVDCNDTNAAIYPSAPEQCNNIDDNCNGTIDDGITFQTYYTDTDGDLYGASNDPGTSSCSAIIGKVLNNNDCNDNNAAINPGATEICDAGNVDENCNNLADNDDSGAADAGKTNFYADADNDTYTVAAATRFCDIVAGYRVAVSASIDCNDNAAAINPGATEICDAANVDENCNNLADNADSGAADAGKTNFYADIDNDTYTLATASRFCDSVTGYRVAVSASIDCNDTNAAINPGVTEICDAANVDENCNGFADNDDSGAADAGKTNFYADIDNDTYTLATASRFCDSVTGYRASASALSDCNDAVAAIHPGATEICDASNVDENCNGFADNDDSGAADAGKTNFYADADNDTYTVASATRFCDIVAGYRVAVSASIDCNDAVAAINPGATEICDASDVDENCNNLADNDDSGAADAGKTNFYADIDNDTYTLATASRFCDSVAGYLVAVSASTDCDDNNAAIHPGAAEVCNGIDDNCVGGIDDGLIFLNYYTDADSDTFGASNAVAKSACAPIQGKVPNNTDCNDNNGAIYPGALETCANIGSDNDCDGVNDAAEASDSVIYYVDTDNDGYGAGAGTASCTPIAGSVTSNTDCNNANSAINPGATEVCDVANTDENCNNLADNDDSGAANAGKTNFYRDADNDTYTVTEATRFCDIVAGYEVAPEGDCNDNNPAIYPGAVENCANLGTDNDCDGVNDAAEAVNSVSYYTDADNDSYGAGLGTASCSPIAGSVTNNTDCNDNNAAINPGATEICDAANVDENCNNLADNADSGAADASKSNFYADTDNDTYTVAAPTRFCDIVSGYLAAVSAPVDCNDNNAAIYPGAPEQCNNIDDNCNDTIDDGITFQIYYTDADTDSFGKIDDPGTSSCSAIIGKVLNHTDCDDNNAAINPGATEICDALNVDENCNSFADNDDSGAADAGKSNFYRDADNDTYTVAAATRFCDIVAGYRVAVSASIDCNDINAAVNPGATEVCDALNVDENCNGFSDNDDSGAADAGRSNFYRDADNDTYTVAEAIRFCDIVAGYRVAVSSPIDCNDNNAAINPGATEICDASNVDENCNNLADNDDSGAADAGKTNFYADLDNDTYTVAAATRYCDIVAGYRVAVSASIDCNDSNAAINPGATEVCNGADDNCVGGIDDGLIFLNYYTDADRDTYGASNASAESACAPVQGKVPNNTDCNDSNAAINPSATEICDGLDNNCDGRVDDGLGSTTYYRDADNDGCGDPADLITTCATTPPAGYVTNSTDGCPTDAAKCSAGTCGCGTPDDADGNNIPDCLELDLSMLPPAPIAAGTSYVVRINAFAVSTLIPMNGMQLAVKFDATRLQLASIDAVAGTPFNTVLGTSVNNTLGTLKYAIGIGADQTGMTSSADLVDLVFTVKPGADLCAQDIQLAQLQAIGSFKNVFVTNTNIGVNPTLYSLPIMDLDSTKPVITGVPASVTAAADPGSTFGAFVPTPTVLVTDNCHVATSGLLITYPNLTTATAWPIDGMFPVGLTTLKWSATDDTGNETIIDRTIDIANWQLLTIKVQFDTRQVGASTRSIRVITGATSQLVNVAMPAWVGATPSVGILADIHIPIAASYSCISAKDNVHSLSAVDFSVDTVGNHYETSYTLIEGDSNDDNRIDVLDFSIFVGDQGNGVATNARSNFDANTVINNADFSCISINFFKRGDTCVAGADADAPLSRVSVKELRRQGLGNLAAADMNGDGWVDLRDMQIYLQGGQAPRASGTHDQGSISGW